MKVLSDTMKKFLIFLALIITFLIIPYRASANSYAFTDARNNSQQFHIQQKLYPLKNTNISGIVDLVQRPESKGTHITLIGFGLRQDEKYVSLYYSNHTCALEPYSVNDVIGTIYTANHGGVGVTQGNTDDNLVAINSVSIRKAGTFELLACADIHPR